MDRLAVKLPEFLQAPDPYVFMGEHFVVFDFETGEKDKGNPLNPENDMFMVAWAEYDHGKITYRRLWADEYGMKALMDVIDRVPFVVAHNTAFEIGWLQRMGYPTHRKLFYCTMLGEKVLAGNRAWIKLSLADSCKRYGVQTKDDAIKPYWDGGLATADIPDIFLEPYCLIDVKANLELFLAQRKKIFDMELMPTQFTRCILTPALQDISRNGMCLDGEAVKKEHAATVQEKLEIDAEMDALTGGINPRSTKQVCEYLFDILQFAPPKDPKTGEPIRKANKNVIDQLVAETPEQQKFIQLKRKQSQVDAALSKALTPFLRCVEDAEKNGTLPIMQFKFSQTTTATHRLSSTGFRYGAQGQNIPRKYKRLFRARHPDYKVGEGDGAQLEFRVATFLGQDKQAMSDITNGEDVHAYTAAVIFGRKKLKMAVDEAFKWIAEHKDTDKVAKDCRQNAKAFTFRPLYGGGDNDETNGYCAAFRAKYHEITTEQDKWKQEVLTTKKLRTKSGLIFYWPDTKMTPSGYITNSTAISNYPVQQLATAEIIPIAVTYLWTYFKVLGLKSFLTNTIHDSAISEVELSEKDVVKSLYERAFVKDVYNYLEDVYDVTFNVPLAVDFGVGTHWSVKDVEEAAA